MDAERAPASDAMAAAALHEYGLAAQRRGALEESRAAFERALELDPTLASASNNLGNTYQQLGDLAAAAQAYERAIAIDPTLFAAYANGAAALHLLGRNDEARRFVRHALAAEPASLPIRMTAAFIDGAIDGFAVTLAQLDAMRDIAPNEPALRAARAYVLVRLERYEEACEEARAALVDHPGHGSLYESLGCSLRALGRLAEADRAFDDAIACGHRVPAMLALKGNGLLEIGDLESARREYEKALAIAPDCADAWSGLMEIAPPAAGDPMVTTMERQLAESTALQRPEPRTAMHFALGKAYDHAGDHANAFRHFAAGNALRRATIAYDIADDERFARETIAHFSADTIARLAARGDASRAPIFVIGMPRSGTTLVESLLAAHPQTHGAGELTFFDRAVDLAGRDDPAEIARRYLAMLDTVAPVERRTIDKLPANFRHAALIHCAFPRARIIHCTRDPLDTCFSAWTINFTGRQDFAFDLVELGRYYRAYAALAQHWRTVLPPEVLCEVAYEDVVADLPGAARRLLAFCGLAWDDRVLRYRDSARPIRTASVGQVRRPIYTTSIGRAQAYRDNLEPLIAALSGAG